MTPQELKNSILQLAIQGKLVEQRPEEGTGEELYKQIQAEKARLIKEGKIKKEKPLPSISEDEIPFEIPESWKWCHISDVSLFQEGPGILAVDFRTNGVPLIRIAGMQGDTVSLNGCNYLDPQMVDQKWAHFRLDKGDVVISTSASLDKIAEVDDEAIGAIPYTGLIRFKMIGSVSKLYFKLFIKSPCYINQIAEQEAGATIKHYGPTHLKRMLIPLPPLEEQKRIVAKIEELLPLVEQYEKAYSRLEQLNKQFPDDMKKSILQLAIQGKLVEQRPEEGTGEELYKQIQAEKAKLIKEGKIKKEKPLPPISEDEIPFEIPESWKPVRLGMIARVLGGKRIPAGRTLQNENNGHVYIRVSDMKNGSVLLSGLKFVPDDIYPLICRYIINKEDLYITVAGTIGDVGIIPKCLDGANLTENADRLVFSYLDQRWFYYALQSFSIKDQIADATTKVGQPKLAIKRIEEFILFLPPILEQRRIVSKIEELLPLCDLLKDK